jgi:hypothetical protein
MLLEFLEILEFSVLFFFFETRSYYVIQAALELEMLLPWCSGVLSTGITGMHTLLGSVFEKILFLHKLIVILTYIHIEYLDQIHPVYIALS